METEYSNLTACVTEVVSNPRFETLGRQVNFEKSRTNFEYSPEHPDTLFENGEYFHTQPESRSRAASSQEQLDEINESFLIKGEGIHPPSTKLSSESYYFKGPEVVDLTTELSMHKFDSTDVPETFYAQENNNQTETGSTKKRRCNSMASQPVSTDLPFRRRKKSLLENITFGTEDEIIHERDPVEEEDQMQQFFETSESDESFLGKRFPRAPLELASSFGGKVVTCKQTSTGTKVSFVCKLNHRFSQDYNEENSSWCMVCRSLLRNAQRFAESNSGRLINTEIAHDLSFTCENGHQWTVNYRKFMRNWCKECRKERKRLVKQILSEETKKEDEERRFRQDKMLEEAKMRMLNEHRKAEEQKEETIKTFRIIEEEIGKMALKYAKDYQKENPKVPLLSVTEMFRVLILPEGSLRHYFDALTPLQLKKEFRRYTIMLHPDKNSHVKAKAAFQKVFGIIEDVMKSRKAQ